MRPNGCPKTGPRDVTTFLAASVHYFHPCDRGVHADHTRDHEDRHADHDSPLIFFGGHVTFDRVDHVIFDRVDHLIVLGDHGDRVIVFHVDHTIGLHVDHGDHMIFYHVDHDNPDFVDLDHVGDHNDLDSYDRVRKFVVSEVSAIALILNQTISLGYIQSWLLIDSIGNRIPRFDRNNP